MKYYVIGVPFIAWKIHFLMNKQITYIDNEDLIDKSCNYKIIPICANDYIRYSKNDLIFNSSSDAINKLNNKSLFAIFMMENFSKYIPKVIYCNINNKTKYISNLVSDIMIQKENIGCAGKNIKIITKKIFLNIKDAILEQKNIIISEYITHNILYTCHLLIINKKIIDKIYFYKNIQENTIYLGQLKNYKTCDTIKCDDTIFETILNKINYSGFVCIDFIINNNKICIFEINPRFGGSLVFNIKYFTSFISKMIKYYNEKID
jgi:predicted ATP-grasp superfamily ATP-dependent carboligase